MVAAGTGITPMINVIRAVLADHNCATRLTLLYASRSQEVRGC